MLAFAAYAANTTRADFDIRYELEAGEVLESATKTPADPLRILADISSGRNR